MSLSESVSRLRTDAADRNRMGYCAVQAEDANAVLNALEQTREALQPFARLSDAYIPGVGTGAWKDGHTVWQVNNAKLTLGDLRRARSVLAEEVPA